MLIKRGVDIEALDNEGKTALHHAVYTSESSSTAIIELLLENRAKVDAVDNGGRTPLHLAMFYTKELCADTIGLLLNHRADLNATEKLSKNALSEAVSRGSSAVAELLLKFGADISGLQAMKYGERDYITLVGEATANNLLRYFANKRGRVPQNTDTIRAQPSKWARVRRKQTVCIMSRQVLS